MINLNYWTEQIPLNYQRGKSKYGNYFNKYTSSLTTRNWIYFQRKNFFTIKKKFQTEFTPLLEDFKISLS